MLEVHYCTNFFPTTPDNPHTEDEGENIIEPEIEHLPPQVVAELHKLEEELRNGKCLY